MIPQVRIRIAFGLIVAMSLAAPTPGLAAGQDETFEGCAERDDRQECCKSAANECAAECERQSESQPASNKDEYLIACQTECASSEGLCIAPPE